MTTFDNILPKISEVLRERLSALASIGKLLINRDLNGRIRLVVSEAVRSNSEAAQALSDIAIALEGQLGRHAFPSTKAILYESNLDAVSQGASTFPLQEFEQVTVIDRLATESDWATISPESKGAPRIVFFSIKGGVGRSTALAAAAWALAQSGKKVLVLDLDLESPGLSSALLPQDRRPTYGIADWLIEDLVDNSEVPFADMTAKSTLSHDGEIYVVPAHGRDPGEYVSKMGRVWMPKVREDGSRENWSQRLSRLIDALEVRWLPDVIFIDSRAGIDEVASSCVTDLGARLVLLFAINGDQTWTGYKILAQHWLKSDVTEAIRERLQIVAAMVPELDGAGYFGDLREQGFDLFTEELYDEIPAGETSVERWNFSIDDEGAPHYPWPIQWHRGFAALRSLHGRLESIGATEVNAVFGEFIERVANAADSGEEME